MISALLLAALGVNEDVIMEDYRLSNDYFNIPKASKYAYKLPVNSQEAITTIYSAKEDFLNAAKGQIESEYGSVQAYLQKGIGLYGRHRTVAKHFINQQLRPINDKYDGAYNNYALSTIHYQLN